MARYQKRACEWKEIRDGRVDDATLNFVDRYRKIKKKSCAGIFARLKLDSPLVQAHYLFRQA